jgi:hypothetical protein
VRVIVFSGPSLPPSAIADMPGLEWRPPLRQGDLYRAVLGGPTALGVIDGVFETTPTVWHDEILFALDRGIAVYGAASIGALRAAELHVYGMKGVGRIFEWFRDGILEDDDEIAVLHGPPELDFLPLTEPMVNVRATVAEAIQCSVIDAATGASIVMSAKSIFYKKRTWDRIFEQAIEAGLSHEELSRARGKLPLHNVDLKRLDARALVQTILQRPTAKTTPP